MELTSSPKLSGGNVESGELGMSKLAILLACVELVGETCARQLLRLARTEASHQVALHGFDAVEAIQTALRRGWLSEYNLRHARAALREAVQPAIVVFWLQNQIGGIAKIKNATTAFLNGPLRVSWSHDCGSPPSWEPFTVQGLGTVKWTRSRGSGLHVGAAHITWAAERADV